MLVMQRKDDFKVIPSFAAAPWTKSAVFSLPFNIAPWEVWGCKRRWPPASEAAPKMLSAKQEAARGHMWARWIMSHWQGWKNVEFWCAVRSAYDYQPAGKPHGLHWRKKESKNGNYMYVWEYQTPYLVSNNCFARKGWVCFFFHLVHIVFLSLKNNTKLNRSM